MSTLSQRPIPPVAKHTAVTIERVEKFLSNIYFTDANLGSEDRYYGESSFSSLKQNTNNSTNNTNNANTTNTTNTNTTDTTDTTPSKEDSMKIQVTTVNYFNAGLQRPSFSQVFSHDNFVSNFKLLSNIKSQSFGPSWSTHWFVIETTLPLHWKAHEVHFRWNSNCEALIYNGDGCPVQGLTGGDGCDVRSEFIITKSALGGEKIKLYIEMACNGMFGVGENGLINPPNPNREFSVHLCEFAVFNREAWSLVQDLKMLYDLSKALPESSPRKLQATLMANKIVNSVDPLDPSTFTVGRQIASEFFKTKNGESQHCISAIGHCHIDTAWLWPYDETIRKCARSWATVVKYMDEYPTLKFACSQAQQFHWVKLHYPGLFDRIKEKVAQGRFIPAGGVWVEMDGNIPSGESMARQFLHGQNFFKKEFGAFCKEFWLPDTFGYSAQLPQIMRLSEIGRFVTQKLSWNLINKFPHSTFFWEGIDGSSVLTHFPPADTYNSQVLPEEVLRSISNFKEHGRSKESMLLFGHGDGGGGPQYVMLERLARLEDCDGVPKIQINSPNHFFEKVEMEVKKENQLLTWVGELYLELHRGTYTSQANNKKGNRKSELLLRDVEFIQTFAAVFQHNSNQYPREELTRLWQLLLLNQFHDVLPGSSIEMVYRDSDAHYADIQSSGKKLLLNGFESISEKSGEKSIVVANSLSWTRTELITLPDSGKTCIVKVPALSVTKVNDALLASATTLSKIVQKQDVIILQNNVLKATLSHKGALLELIHLPTGKNAISPQHSGNKFILFDDIPLFWDAWDILEYHVEKSHTVESEATFEFKESDHCCSVQFNFPVGKGSWLKQTVVLSDHQDYLLFDTEIEWRESRKCLKVEFPFNVRSPQASYEIQFGHIQRPTHANTSWDMARFEVCGHRWADLSEHGFGVALLNDCKYGYSTRGNTMRLSLLRSPKAPDAECDMGRHYFKYAVMPHQGSLQDGGVIKAASQLNSPLIVTESCLKDSVMKDSLFAIQAPETQNCGVVIDTIKLSENNSKTVIVRMYDSFGGHSNNVSLVSAVPFKSAKLVNILENPLSDLELLQNGHRVELSFSAFEIKTVAFEF